MTNFPEPSAEVLDAVDRGNKIQAIKLYRQDTGLGLREAKDVIDRIAGHGASPSGGAVTKTFKGDQASLAQQLDADFRLMSAQGYVVEWQTPRPGHKSLFNRHPQDEMVVTYRRSSAAQPAAGTRAAASNEQDRYAQLDHNARLKAEGVLSEEEFEHEKRRILGY
jgi:hypothetical protein